jgi:hypothetical protein
MKTKTASATLHYSSIQDLLSEIEHLSKTNTIIEKQIAKIEGKARLNRSHILANLQASIYHLKKYRLIMDTFLDTCIKEESKRLTNNYKPSPIIANCHSMLDEMNKSMERISSRIDDLIGKKNRPRLTVINGGKSKTDTTKTTS